MLTIEVVNLPPYSPEYNATECLWKYTRKGGTHNHCFDSKDELQESLLNVFTRIQRNPERIRGYLKEVFIELCQ
jgi:transposase